MNYPEFQQGDNDLLSKYSAQAEARRTDYGAIGAQSPPPPVGTAPPTGNPILDFFGHLFGGGSQAAPPGPPAPTPSPDQPMQYDIQSGKLVPLPPVQ
jgi:hypothetical protein